VVYGIHVAEGDPPDEVLRLAAKTGGDVFAADDQAGLEEVFAKIDSMQKAEIERTVAEQQDHFQPYAALGLSLLLVWLLASFGWRYTPW
jgi:Ca-activated chloride channel family protein